MATLIAINPINQRETVTERNLEPYRSDVTRALYPVIPAMKTQAS
jgi:hypothetical protein